MRSHAKASSAKSTYRKAAALVVAITALVFLFAALFAGTAWALDTCPNAVFRTGPAAKLPECRAYELVSPPDTEGMPPTSSNFGKNVRSRFPHVTITSSGDDLYFQTNGGALGDSPGNGESDRYRVRRTSQGWTTSFEGVTGAQTQDATWYGGASPDLDYYVVQTWTIKKMDLPDGDYLRTPDGLEVLAKGSLGEFLNGKAWDEVEAFEITEGGQHVIFYAPYRLEPEAPSSGLRTIYDRSVDGPTRVVSLLPGNVTPSTSSWLTGVSEDARDVVFDVSASRSPHAPRYVRHDNTVTYEVERPEGTVVGKKLVCGGGPETATLSHQWLRNGNPIGVTTATYTTTAADESKVVQCVVSAGNSDGASLGASVAYIVEPYAGTNPAMPPDTETTTNVGAAKGVSVTGTPTVGQLLTCNTESWKGSPSFSYQWLQNGTEIGGAISNTYTTLAGDQGKAIQCRVTGSNADGAAVSFSEATVIAAPVATASAAPVIANQTDPDNAPTSGDQLSCSPGTWTNSPSFTYQWLRNGTEIGGATSSTYSVEAADEEKTLQCRVKATSSGGATQAVSNGATVDPQPASAVPVQTSAGGVFGTAQVGETLFCGEGSWDGSPSFIYQWLQNGEEISGATDGAYTLTPSDLETVIQCRLTATNAGGSTVAVDASAFGAWLVSPAPAKAVARIPRKENVFAGVYGGHVFYAAVKAFGAGVFTESSVANLYSYDIATQKTTMISSDSDDSYFTHISADGSHVYFLSKTEVGGEGEAGKPNLYVWKQSDHSTKLVATLGAQNPVTGEYLDLDSRPGAIFPNLHSWLGAEDVSGRVSNSAGIAKSHTESSADGSVLLFTARSQLTSFDNTEGAAADCQSPKPQNVDEGGGVEVEVGERCLEVYRYDSNTGDITCVSCPPGSGPAHGDARLQYEEGGSALGEPSVSRVLLDNNTVVRNMTDDTQTVFFESRDSLVPEDDNGRLDVYRWNESSGLALISTGKDIHDSFLYGVTPNGSNVVFVTGEALLPWDENGGTQRLYDARVDGGFPPPESVVTEPCAGDICQGAPTAAPQTRGAASTSLNGTGNLAQPRCHKGQRRVSRNGKQLCKPRKHRKHTHRQAGTKRGAAR